MIHRKYQELQQRLKHFSQSIKKGPECQNVLNELTNLHAFYSQADRSLVERAIRLSNQGAKKVELSVEDSQRLSAYSQEVTTKVSSIVSALTNRSDCIEPKKKTSVLYPLAAITQEVASLSASFSGPYGMMIQAGGAVVSGILRGIDWILTRNKDPYDFDLEEDRMVFITSLCTYHGIREEISNLTNTEKLEATHKEYFEALAFKKKLLLEKHGLVRAFEDLHQLRQAHRGVADSFRASIAAIEANQKGTAWDRCLAVSKLFHNRGESSAERLMSVLEDSRLAPYIARQPQHPREIHQIGRGPQGVPNDRECLGMKNDSEVDAKNNWSLSLLKELVSSFDYSFEVAFRELRQESRQKDVPVYAYPPIEWLELNYAKLKWGEEQMELILELKGPGSFAARREITDQKMYLDRRFFSELAPRFVNWYAGDLEASYRRFLTRSEETVRKLAQEHFGTGWRERAPNWEEFLTRLMAQDTPEGSIGEGIAIPDIAELTSMQTRHSSIYFQIDSLVSELQKSLSSLVTVATYCDYLRAQGTLSGELRPYCEFGETVREYQERLKSISGQLEKFDEYMEWCHKFKIVDRTSLEALLQIIKASHDIIGIPEKDRPKPPPVAVTPPAKPPVDNPRPGPQGSAQQAQRPRRAK